MLSTKFFSRIDAGCADAAAAHATVAGIPVEGVSSQLLPGTKVSWTTCLWDGSAIQFGLLFHGRKVLGVCFLLRLSFGSMGGNDSWGKLCQGNMALNDGELACGVTS